MLDKEYNIYIVISLSLNKFLPDYKGKNSDWPVFLKPFKIQNDKERPEISSRSKETKEKKYIYIYI